MHPAAAQTRSKVFRIAYLTNDIADVDAPRRNAFRQGLRDLGYVEGRNIAIDYRVGGGDSSKLAELADQLLALKPDVVFAFTAEGVQAAKNAAKDVPIVFAAHAPVELGFVTSLARPGGNVTGLSLTVGADIYGKHIELLKLLNSKMSRVAAVSNPLNPATAVQLKEARTAASALGVTLLSFDVRAPADLDVVFEAISRERVDALTVLADPMLLGERARIARLSVKSRLPSIYGIPEFVEAGGLMSYAADRLDIFRRAATYVDRILKGAKPGELPVEQPTKFDLLINAKTAEQLGLKIPSDLLVRADRIIR